MSHTEAPLLAQDLTNLCDSVEELLLSLHVDVRKLDALPGIIVPVDEIPHHLQMGCSCYGQIIDGPLIEINDKQKK